jgi:hypothetical protein
MPHRGCKKTGILWRAASIHAPPPVENEIESCKQVILSLRMKPTVIQPYFDVALDVVHHDDKLLSDATNETFVSDMLCRDNKEVCKHCMEKLQY